MGGFLRQETHTLTELVSARYRAILEKEWGGGGGGGRGGKCFRERARLQRLSLHFPDHFRRGGGIIFVSRNTHISGDCLCTLSNHSVKGG